MQGCAGSTMSGKQAPPSLFIIAPRQARKHACNFKKKEAFQGKRGSGTFSLFSSHLLSNLSYFFLMPPSGIWVCVSPLGLRRASTTCRVASDAFSINNCAVVDLAHQNIQDSGAYALASALGKLHFILRRARGRGRLHLA